jgi:hypothetical protein
VAGSGPGSGNVPSPVSAQCGQEELLAQLRRELPGWRVWYTQTYMQQEHTWSAMPEGAKVATCTTSRTDQLLARCREYEASLADHILSTQEALDKEAGTATPERLKLLNAALDAQLNLRVRLAASR